MSLVGMSATASGIYRIVKLSHGRLPERLRSIETSSRPVEGTTGANSSEWERNKSLAKRAVRAFLLCVRSVFDRIHHVSPTTTNCALDRCTRQLRVLLLLIAHWTAVQEKGCHRTSRTRLTVVRAIRV